MTAAASDAPLAAYRERLRGLSHAVPPVVVACSGGADSLALLALAVDAALEPIAVYVDHGLRPDSEKDAKHVSDLARRIGARFEMRRVHIASGSNLEARARDARYEALEDARREHRASVVLVAHTADDQAETVLLNLLRGSGATGLSGMPERRGHVVRPLLGVRRFETVELCARLGIRPLHDPMNDDLSFRRVWLRNEVLPLLERGAQRDVVALLARQADVLRAESELLDRLGAAAWPPPSGPSARELAALELPLARRAARVWLGPPPPSLEEVDAVLAVARGERRAVDLAGGRRVWRRDGLMRVTHPAG